MDDLLIPMSNSPMQDLCWSLLLLAEKSDIQNRVQSELDNAIGVPLRAELSIQSIVEKRSKLTYSMATFWEVCLIGFDFDGAVVVCSVPQSSHLRVHILIILTGAAFRFVDRDDFLTPSKGTGDRS